MKQLSHFEGPTEARESGDLDHFTAELSEFCEFGKQTAILDFTVSGYTIPMYVNEFWTAKQRAAHSLHEVSYRACFKPQLPEFFIKRLTKRGDTVYDPFMGRGTTVLEAALLGRAPAGCDINPLSQMLVSPRLNPPTLDAVRQRLESIDLDQAREVRDDLLVFYHPETLASIANLREYLIHRAANNSLDCVDSWIRMTATNRLTGHSTGFFSVYTLPPNQAVSIASQIKINDKRSQVPPNRDVRAIIMRKSKSLLRSLSMEDRDVLSEVSPKAKLLTGSADRIPSVRDESVALVVTSPPFLDVVDYQADNWLRCWFNGISPDEISIWHLRSTSAWQERMACVFRELHRILKRGGYVAFEVGEVRGGTVLLEELVVPAAARAGLSPLMVIVNAQVFTKTANCWGVDNLRKGTNTNRIVLMTKR